MNITVVGDTNFTIQVDQWHAKHCEEIVGGFGLAHERNLGTTKCELRKLVCDVWVRGYFPLWNFV